MNQILIRKARLEDAPAITRVHVDSWRSTYAGIVSAEYLAAISSEKRETMWRSLLSDPAGTDFICVAETPAGGVVGFASSGPQRGQIEGYAGEIYALYLLQNHQRQGLGRLLFNAAAADLRQRGLNSLMLWVLAENPSRKFYEALGGQALCAEEIELGGQRLMEVAYGWKNGNTIHSTLNQKEQI